MHMRFSDANQDYLLTYLLTYLIKTSTADSLPEPSRSLAIQLIIGQWRGELLCRQAVSSYSFPRFLLSLSLFLSLSLSLSLSGFLPLALSIAFAFHTISIYMYHLPPSPFSLRELGSCRLRLSSFNFQKTSVK